MTAPTHRIQLALPFAFLGLVSAFYVADFWRFSPSGREGAARGVLAFALPLVCGGLGFALSARRIERSRGATASVLVLGTLVAGGLLGALTGAVFARPKGVGASVQMGILTAAALLPLAGAMTFLARRVGRARVGSIVDEADRRAPWIVVCACAAAGSVALRFNDHVVAYTASVLPASTSVSIGLAGLALVAAVVGLACDCVGWARVRVARRQIAAMSPRDPDIALPCSHVVDLGLGAEEHEELVGGPAYRSSAQPIAVVRGAPDEAAPAMGHAARRSLAIVAASALAVALAPLLASRV